MPPATWSCRPRPESPLLQATTPSASREALSAELGLESDKLHRPFQSGERQRWRTAGHELQYHDHPEPILSGSYSAIDGLGRGIGSFSASAGSADFVYYVVSANRYRFICPDTATFFLGSADLQTQSSFANSDFNGNYVVSNGPTRARIMRGVSYTLIQFNASGGNVASGSLRRK